MSVFNEQLLVTLSAHISEKYPNIRNTLNNVNFTLYSILTVPALFKIEQICQHNPIIIDEAISLKEYADVLSLAYSNEPLSQLLTELIENTRAIETSKLDDICLFPEVLKDYFTTPNKMKVFLQHNPFFIGLYLFILLNGQ